MMAQIRQTISKFIYPEGEIERRNLQDLAYIDELTGLGNRRAFNKADARNEFSVNLAYVVFDLNNLGMLNKKVGHSEGDARIQFAGEVIMTVASAMGIARNAFRTGGDEFVVLCRDDQADSIIENVVEIFGVHEYEGFEVSVGGAWGYTFEHADGQLQEQKRLVKARHARAA